MSDNAKRRLSIDLDEIERQLRQGGPAGGQPPAPKSDPLSELARIVGQDDPFGALLDEDQARRGGRGGREADLSVQPAPRAPAAADRRAPAADPRGPDVDADDPRAEYAARGFPVDEDGYVDDPDYREDYAEVDYDDGYGGAPGARRGDGDGDGFDDGYAPHDDAADWAGDAAGYPDEDEPPRRGAARKSLVTAAALVAVALVGVGSALWFAGSVDQTGGEPPLITADSEPARVAPADPGGVQIPNQDTALLDRQDGGEANVVDREEQPVDIAGLATDPQPGRTAPRVVLPAPGADAADDPIGRAIGEDGLGALSNGLEPPLVTSPAVAALGEPRRVRTVTVRPDGSIVGPSGLTPAPAAPARTVDAPAEQPAVRPAEQPAETAALDPAPLEPIAVAPALPQGPAPDDLPASALGRSGETPAAVSAPVPPPAPARASPPPTAATAQPAAAPQASGPLQLSAIPSPAPAPTAPAASGPTGGFAVQLAIRGSEARAQEAFQQIQAQYASIIGDGEPIIRQAVVNGSTIYRVRVGAYSLERATQACDQIKSAGGDCFVAPNR